MSDGWSLQKIGSTILFVIVLVVVFILVLSKPGEGIASGLKNILNIQHTEICQENSAFCTIKNCDTEKCTDEEKKVWDKQKTTSNDDLIKLLGTKKDSILDINYNLKDYKKKLGSKTYNNLVAINIKKNGNNINGLDYLEQKSKENGINPIFAFLILEQESKGNPNDVSGTGATGLFQFTYTTAFKEYFAIFGTKYGCEMKDTNLKNCVCWKNGQIDTNMKCTEDARLDPKKSIQAGTLYLSELSKKYKGDIVLTLAAYNAGASVANKCTGEEDAQSTKSCVLSNVKTTSKKTEVNTYIVTIHNKYVTSIS